MSLLLGNTTQGANPSPSSPQAIHTVTGDNEIRVVGKNLAQITPQTKTVNGVTITVDENLLVTATGTATASGGRLTFFSDVIRLTSGSYTFRKVTVSGTSQVGP